VTSTYVRLGFCRGFFNGDCDLKKNTKLVLKQQSVLRQLLAACAKRMLDVSKQQRSSGRTVKRRLRSVSSATTGRVSKSCDSDPA
jgi:hypothetical protein